MTLREMIEKCKKLDPKIWIASYVLISALLLYWYPLVQVSHFEINNATSNATLENQFRTTLAQILGGGAVAIGIYFAWKNFITAQENLKVAQEGQINERFTRAIDQLGAIDQLANPSLEIRLGGIYSLEGIANESEEYYWPIMEILTAYVRKNSPVELAESQDNISLDIQAILTVIGRRKNSLNHGESIPLNLQDTWLQKGDIHGAHLEGANFERANLEGAYLKGANLDVSHLELSHLQKINLNNASLEKANLYGANLEGAYLNWVNFKGANLHEANLKDANLYEANLEVASLADTHLEGAKLIEANLEGASLADAHLEGTQLIGANLIGANLKGAKNLTVDQLSKVKTLYNAELDLKLEEELRAKGFSKLLDENQKINC